MGFDLESYEPVQSRFARFIEWASTRENVFSVISEMLTEPGAEICVFKTSILMDGVLMSTGHAEEIRGAGNVNRTSHVENCETSSLGRALANFPLMSLAGSDYTKRPSREEMSKAATSNGRPMTTVKQGNVTVTKPQGLATDKQKNMIRAISKQHGMVPPKNLDSMTIGEASDVITKLKAGEANALADQEDHNLAAEEPF